VRYVTERPKITTAELRVFAGRSKKGPALKDTRYAAFDALFLSKSDQWGYEREWRLIDERGESGYCYVPCLKLSALIFGALTPSEFIEAAMSVVGNAIPAFQAAPSRDSYDMALKQIA
jgi:hypothetical protein